MKPKISLITLGVSDLERSAKFYRDGLGFPTEGDNEGVVFLKLEETWLSLFPAEKLAEDATVPANGSGFRSFTLAHNVDSKEKVDEVLKLAEKAGAKIIKPGQDTFWGGYSGYFADPGRLPLGSRLESLYGLGVKDRFHDRPGFQNLPELQSRVCY